MTEASAFEVPARAEKLLARIRALPGGAAFPPLLADCASPDASLLNLDRFVDAAGVVPGDPEAAVLLFAGSQSMSQAAGTCAVIKTDSFSA